MDQNLWISEINSCLNAREVVADEMDLTIKKSWIIPTPRHFIPTRNHHLFKSNNNERLSNLDNRIIDNIHFISIIRKLFS